MAPAPSAVSVADPRGPFDLFLVGTPGLESRLADEARALGLGDVREMAGGVSARGSWEEIWRANQWLRTATRVLIRVAEFRALHLAQLDKRTRKVDWAAFLAPGTAVAVDATCRASRIYHDRAASQRVAAAMSDALGEGAGPPLSVKVRLDDDLCTISLDTSGAPLHKRGTKLGVGKAPLRETLAAAFLAECGFDGSQPVMDPMCGSGTFVLEAAAWAAGLAPGRARDFALGAFPAATGCRSPLPDAVRPTDVSFQGSDRDGGAIDMARASADRGGLAGLTAFRQLPISEAVVPDGPPGLIMVNPPYGARIGNKKLLYGLYGALGARLGSFKGWHVGLVTTDAGLARATGLPFDKPGPPIPHGGLKVRLFKTGPL